jgi:hypothetical protein
MKIIMSKEEFTALVIKHLNTVTLIGTERKIESIGIPSPYSHNQDVTITLEDIEDAVASAPEVAA